MSIREAIEARHAKDLIVSECKDGPTWTSNHLRLDYWVLRRSWTNPAMIGYECKSGRQDFLKDDKWRGYLPLCNELWFVQEKKGAIQPEELPEGVGLLTHAKSRLITVRKAVWREIPCPEGLLTYVLMCRATIDAPKPRTATTADEWRALLAEKDERRIVGRACSKRIREAYYEMTGKLDWELKRQADEIKRLADIREYLDARKIQWNGYATRPEDVARELTVPVWTRNAVERARNVLNELLPPTPAPKERET